MTDYPKFASITAKEMETVQERRKGKLLCTHYIFKKLRIKCYLHHGGFCASLLQINRLPGRVSSSCVNGPIHWVFFKVLFQKQTLGLKEDYNWSSN